MVGNPMSFSEDQARKTLQHDAEQLQEKDLGKVTSNWDKIEHKLRHSPRLAPYAERAIAAYQLIRAYIRGDYREVPWGSIASLAAALLYVLNPMDMVPDFIPFFGFVDDASVLLLCLKLIGKDLDKYLEHQNSEQSEHQQQ